MDNKEMTPTVPQHATMVPARADVMSKCDSAMVIPKVSNEAMLPFVDTFNNMHPNMQQS